MFSVLLFLLWAMMMMMMATLIIMGEQNVQHGRRHLCKMAAVTSGRRHLSQVAAGTCHKSPPLPTPSRLQIILCLTGVRRSARLT